MKNLLASAKVFKSCSVISQLGYYNDNGCFVDIDINKVSDSEFITIKFHDINGYLFTIKQTAEFFKLALHKVSGYSGKNLPVYTPVYL